MRILSVFTAMLFLIAARSAVSAVDVSDLGVPNGLSAAAYDNVGNDLLNKGDYKGAKRYLDAAIRVRPDFWMAYYNRAMTFSMQKNYTAALQDLNTTIKLEPAFFLASYTRALTYIDLGNYAAGLKDLDLLANLTVKVQEWGHNAVVLKTRAWLRATCPNGSFRNAQLAIADAKKACGLSYWKESGDIDTLSAGYAEAGDFDFAIRYEEQAINLIKSGADETWHTPGYPISEKAAKQVAQLHQDSLVRFTKHLESYRQHHPWRDAPH